MEKSNVKFNEINLKNLTGTFYGKLFLYNTSTGQNIILDEDIISEGEFNVPRNNQ